MDAHSLKRNALAVVVGLMSAVLTPAYAGNSDSVTIVFRAGPAIDRTPAFTQQQFLQASERLAQRRKLFFEQRSGATVTQSKQQCAQDTESATSSEQCDNLTINNSDR